MTFTLTPQTITSAAAVLTAAGVIITALIKLVRWFRRQKQQDRELSQTREELTLLTYGVLACLKGLKEQGCNGPVTEAINKIEKYINKRAHESAE